MTPFDPSARLASTTTHTAMTGTTALLRAVVEQQRADTRAGRNIAGLVCGYRGSPLGGVDSAFAEYRSELDAASIRFIDGVNEDLAATVVLGGQLAALEPDSRVDGVLGLWYGKSPGLDRSCDALRHANVSGIGPNGGVLVAVGDDPACKSSTLPSASEGILAQLRMPVLSPSTVQEVVDFGRLGYELSRASGLWVGMKVHTDIADAYQPVTFEALEIRPLPHDSGGNGGNGAGWRPLQDGRLMAPYSIDLDRDLLTSRLDAARSFLEANERFDKVVGAADPTMTVVASGLMWHQVLAALARLGLDESRLGAAGVKVVAPAAIWPLSSAFADHAVGGCAEVLVVEERGPFVESQLKELLYNSPRRPTISGVRDVDGRPLVPSTEALTTDALVAPLARTLGRVLPTLELTAPRQRIAVTSVDAPARTAYFCSGCPHNTSTRLPEGSVGAAGIGCHGMALTMDRGHTTILHMGGEGAQWVGTSAFVDQPHRFQNLGDGTLYHSGTLAIRQAVSANANITYKILFNDAVAMTGGQDAAGGRDVVALTHLLSAEGVRRIVVVTDAPGKFPRRTAWASGVTVRDRSDLDAVQRELREIAGVTALIYDQPCAANLRRDRKRGKASTPGVRVMIDESICDGCGDCGAVSNCLSVHPVDTPLGRKTRIDQDSCNLDMSCLQGNCPAFVTIKLPSPSRRPTSNGSPPAVIAPAGPAPAVGPQRANVVLVGVGGTGVVTVNQILATAALLEGRPAVALDQTGMSQKGGPVVSQLRIEPPGSTTPGGAARLGAGEADALIAFDPIAAMSPAVLTLVDPGRTRAVINTSVVPTGAMVAGRASELAPTPGAIERLLGESVRREASTFVDGAAVADRAFKSPHAANLILLGVAFQQGLLPLRLDSIQSAIEANGVSVDANRRAFELGRSIAVDPAKRAQLSGQARAEVAPVIPSDLRSTVDALAADDPELRELLAWRLPHLAGWGSHEWAKRYLDVIRPLRDRERTLGSDSRLSRTAATQLAKLMTYKDEYEVARLALASDMTASARARFGDGLVVERQLKPPILGRVGIDRKIALRPALAGPAFRILRAGRRLRFSRFDPFGRTVERRIERELIHEYAALIGRVTAALDATNYDNAVELLRLADDIRGFDTVKLARVERYRRDVADASTWLAAANTS